MLPFFTAVQTLPIPLYKDSIACVMEGRFFPRFESKTIVVGNHRPWLEVLLGICPLPPSLHPALTHLQHRALIGVPLQWGTLDIFPGRGPVLERPGNILMICVFHWLPKCLNIDRCPSYYCVLAPWIFLDIHRQQGREN